MVIDVVGRLSFVVGKSGVPFSPDLILMDASAGAQSKERPPSENSA
jgi:hypothetical protein